MRLGTNKETRLPDARESFSPFRRLSYLITTIDQFLADEDGRSFISYKDYAVALVDELETPRHVGRRYGVAY
ncbi:MAG: hypothetical protein ACREMK_04745 [Gemmatimonadota bacterium]